MRACVWCVCERGREGVGSDGVCGCVGGVGVDVCHEQFPAVLAGWYRRVTGRRVYVAGQRPDAQQAVKELARGMSSPTDVRLLRLKRVTRYLVKKRVSIWEFAP